jgi:aspartate/methionine/tyrosine aminotransferase
MHSGPTAAPSPLVLLSPSTALTPSQTSSPPLPPGQCLSQDNLAELIKFAHNEKIVLMADEVYQENVYQDERPFVSARKVMAQMGEPYASSVELLSFHTVSKVGGGGWAGWMALQVL